MGWGLYLHIFPFSSTKRLREVATPTSQRNFPNSLQVKSQLNTLQKSTSLWPNCFHKLPSLSRTTAAAQSTLCEKGGFSTPSHTNPILTPTSHSPRSHSLTSRNSGIQRQGEFSGRPQGTRVRSNARGDAERFSSHKKKAFLAAGSRVQHSDPLGNAGNGPNPAVCPPEPRKIQ